MGVHVRLGAAEPATPTDAVHRRVVRSALLLAAVPASILLHRPVIAQDTVLGVLVCAVTVTLVATGVLLAAEPGQRMTARLFLLTGLMWSLTWLASWQEGWLPAVASLGAGYAGVGAWGLLRYPRQRLDSTVDRVWVAATISWLALGKLVVVTFSRPEWLYEVSDVWWPPTLAHRELFLASLVVYNAGAAVLALMFPVLFVRRHLRLTGLDRRVTRPVAVAAVASCVGTAAVAINKAVGVTAVAHENVYRITALALLAVPLAFLAAVVRRQLAFAGLSQLVARVAAKRDAGDVELALRDALGDESVRLLYWVPSLGAYANDVGHRMEVQPSAERTVVPVFDADGRPLACVTASRDLERHGDLLQAAVQACGLALENTRLQAGLRAQLEEVRASRERIVEAGVAERRRLERDLHDGAQQRLLALNLQLSAAETRVADDIGRAALQQAKGQLREALLELRELARGIHPALLTQSGVGPALQAVAERLPLDVQLTVPSQRFAPRIETTAYYLVCEALANSVKHAQASSAMVHLAAGDRELLITVSDDGVGGATRTGGLAGLEDRVRALGGDLVVTSPPGLGTALTARLPCG